MYPVRQAGVAKGKGRTDVLWQNKFGTILHKCSVIGRMTRGGNAGVDRNT